MKKYKIALDWDGSGEHNYVKNEVMILIGLGHYVEIVTTRWENVANYPWYKSPRDDKLHDSLFEFAKQAGIEYHFTNMVFKAKYLEDNNFDYLIDDNSEEAKGLIKCRFIPAEKIHAFTKELIHEAKDGDLQST
jgi:hypothetical protein